MITECQPLVRSCAVCGSTTNKLFRSTASTHICQQCLDSVPPVVVDLDAPEPPPAPQPRPIPESPKEMPPTKSTPDRQAETPGARPIPGTGTVNEPLVNPTPIDPAAPFGRTKDGKPRRSPAGRKPASNRVRLAYVNLNPETLQWLQANAVQSHGLHKAEAIGRAIDKAVQSAITHEHCNV
jgi:hypothetical protein